jgi:uncharacterized membrane protein YqjE
MLKSSDDMQAGERPDMSQLLERLAQESRAWADAEVTLAQIELAELKAQAMRAAGFAAIGLAALICTMLALTEAGIALLGPYVSSMGIAALVMAAILAVITAACAYSARRAVAWRTESMFFRWLGSKPERGGRP